uniref:DNA alkylation repair protein n=1 Tax=Thaumasiovibrio occultus TaxID=1891184 RepID=UPI000B3600C6|nr:DNA alkylation repair protein [Thaumasiovibrio occultus]
MSYVFPMILVMQKKLVEQADPVAALEMQRYMKIPTPFYGVKAPERREIFKQAREHTKITTFQQYAGLIRWLWCGQYREEQYLALDVAEHYKALRNDERALDLFIELMESADHWDTLDKLASALIGPKLIHSEDLIGYVTAWRQSESLWVRRAALLVMLKHKTEVNRELLEETVRVLSTEDEFFIRKAIGWLLREHGKTSPDWVKSLLSEVSLSALSYREANRIMVLEM